LNKYKRER